MSGGIKVKPIRMADSTPPLAEPNPQSNRLSDLRPVYQQNGHWAQVHIPYPS